MSNPSVCSSSSSLLTFVDWKLQEDTVWPKEGKHILATFDEEGIVVYQAFNPAIAKYAVEHQAFGGPEYSFSRMSWVKTNYLWMMYRAGWASKPNQEHILAIKLTHSFFHQILNETLHSSISLTAEEKSERKSLVRLQWDPDHFPDGTKHPTRKAVQLGLKGLELKANFNRNILKIEDITEQVRHSAEAHQVLDKKAHTDCLIGLETPQEFVYFVQLPVEIREHIMLDEQSTEESAEESSGPAENKSEEDLEVSIE